MFESYTVVNLNPTSHASRPAPEVIRAGVLASRFMMPRVYNPQDPADRITPDTIAPDRRLELALGRLDRKIEDIDSERNVTRSNNSKLLQDSMSSQFAPYQQQEFSRKFRAIMAEVDARHARRVAARAAFPAALGRHVAAAVAGRDEEIAEAVADVESIALPFGGPRIDAAREAVKAASAKRDLAMRAMIGGHLHRRAEADLQDAMEGLDRVEQGRRAASLAGAAQMVRDACAGQPAAFCSLSRASPGRAHRPPRGPRRPADRGNGLGHVRTGRRLERVFLTRAVAVLELRVRYE